MIEYELFGMKMRVPASSERRVRALTDKQILSEALMEKIGTGAVSMLLHYVLTERGLVNEYNEQYKDYVYLQNATIWQKIIFKIKRFLFTKKRKG